MKRSYKRLHLGMRALLILSIVALAGSSLINIRPAKAFTVVSDKVSRSKISTGADHTIRFGGAHAGLAAGETITVDLSNFDTASLGAFNFQYVDLSVGSVADCEAAVFGPDETLAAAPSGATWGVSEAGGVITFTSGTATIAPNVCVEVEVGHNATAGGVGITWVTNPASAASTLLTIGGTWGESGTAAVSVTNEDKVTVTATVSESITCDLGTTTAAYFGTLTPTTPRYATSTIGGSATDPAAGSYTISNSTNAINGIRITVNGATLTSGANTISAIGNIAVAASTADSEQFGMYADADNVDVNEVSPYSDTTTPKFAFVVSTDDLVASSTGPAAVNSLELHLMTRVANNTESGTYSTTLTNICTGNF